MTGIVNKSSTHPEDNKGACIIVLRGSERAGYKKPADGFRRAIVELVGKAHVIAEKEQGGKRE